MESGAERVDLSQVQLTPELFSCVPAELARAHRLLPIWRHGESLTIVMGTTQPDLNEVDEVFRVVRSGPTRIRTMQIGVADPEDLARHIEKLYGLAPPATQQT
jgi:hypothetical protein